MPYLADGVVVLVQVEWYVQTDRADVLYILEFPA
jgi:hypothetical protein